MKSSLCHGLRFGWLLMGLLSLGTAQLNAQVATNAASSGQRPAPLLDNDEMAQLNHAREKVFAAHPDLKTENEKLKAMHDATSTPTDDQRNAANAEWKAYRDKMRAEMLKVDPTLKPVFTKIDAARKNGTPVPFPPATAK